MKPPFERTRDGALRARLPAEGVALLSAVLEDLLHALDEDDPSLGRLFPRAYQDEEEEARFRDLTHGFLAAAKRGAIELLREALRRGSPTKRGLVEIDLDEDEVSALLGATNDVRLVLGSRLEVTDDDQPRGFLPPGEPRAGEVNAYLWLGALQEAILTVLLAERGTAGTD